MAAVSGQLWPLPGTVPSRLYPQGAQSGDRPPVTPLTRSRDTPPATECGPAEGEQQGPAGGTDGAYCAQGPEPGGRKQGAVAAAQVWGGRRLRGWGQEGREGARPCPFPSRQMPLTLVSGAQSGPWTPEPAGRPQNLMPGRHWPPEPGPWRGRRPALCGRVGAGASTKVPARGRAADHPVPRPCARVGPGGRWHAHHQQSNRKLARTAIGVPPPRPGRLWGHRRVPRAVLWGSAHCPASVSPLPCPAHLLPGSGTRRPPAPWGPVW